ncbi:asparagine synthase [Halocatena marina]|uniref:Asparagine synthase n=1 Tax=Halocatena marina TaxID=2934937 RepID=A0ABD5YK64_9EURY|nr:asparagine synthase [Halocatena marina]
MVGLCGSIGQDALPEAMAEYISWGDDEETVSYSDDRIDLQASLHSLIAGDQPVAVEDEDVLLWIWGDVYGYGSRSNYVPRRGPPDGSAEFCAHLYEVFGMDFVSGLNGNFALVIYDQTENAVSFVTDRFATRPLYYAQPTDDTLIVSSQSQSLTLHPDIEPAFDLPYLYEYLDLRRVFGVKTPIAGVEQFPPGSIITVDLDDLTMTTTSYWSPTYDPIDKPYSYFQEQFVETIQQVFSDWTYDDLSYGLLLSGGSDSRLGLAAIDQPVTTFHNADWMSREAKIARRAANATDNTFKLLERGPDYDAGLLENASPLSNFSGWFDQAYFLGFEEEVTAEVDVLVSGLYADTLLGGGQLETPTVSLDPLGNLTIPTAQSVNSIDEYIDSQISEGIEPLPYFSDDWSLSSVLSDNIHETRDGIVSHGIHYDSIEDLVMYGGYYPLSSDTDAIFSESLAQMRPYRTPFLDNRIVDLQQQIPKRFFLRRNFVNKAVEQIDPALAEIPHAHTGVPLKYPFIVEYLGTNLNGLWWKHVADTSVPEPYLDHTPWPNREELIRARPFTTETLNECSEYLSDLSFLDVDGAWQCYHEHLDGEDNTTILYSLLTFLRMRATEAVHHSSQTENTDRSTPVIEPNSTASEGKTR